MAAAAIIAALVALPAAADTPSPVSGQVLQLSLLPPAPHPCNGKLAVRFSLPAATDLPLRVLIYDLCGRTVFVGDRLSLQAGNWTISYDLPRAVRSGVYVLAIASETGADNRYTTTREADSFQILASQRLVLVR